MFKNNITSHFILQIGGFGTQGVTNQISYFLPSQGEWNGLTKVPHVECSNFGCATLGYVLCNQRQNLKIKCEILYLMSSCTHNSCNILT